MAKKVTTVLSAQELRAKKSVKPMAKKARASKIDFSDIPELTDEQLAKFKRRGRPIIGESPRKAISIRIEVAVLEKIKVKAKKQKIAYQSLINEILKKAV